MFDLIFSAGISIDVNCDFKKGKTPAMSEAGFKIVFFFRMVIGARFLCLI